MTDNQKLIASVIAGLLVLAKGCGNVPPQPDPPTPQIVAKSFDDYRSLMGQAWSAGAAKSFATDREAFDWIKGEAEMARKSAFAPVHQLEQDAFGGENWNDETRKGVWSKFAKECE